MDMDIVWMRARDFAQREGVNKEWIIRLAQSGRLEGAYKAGGVWLVPSTAQMPDRGVRGPKVEIDLGHQAMAEAEIRARMANRTREARRAKQRARILVSPQAQTMREKIAVTWASGGHYDEKGCFTDPRGNLLPQYDLGAFEDWEYLWEYWGRLEEGTALN